MDKGDDFTVFDFTDGSRVSLPNGDVKVVDCTIFDPPVLAVDAGKGTWTINKVLTSIPEEPGLKIDDAYPVCIWFDEDCVYIAMNNGQRLVIGRDPAGSLSSFSFYASDNLGLSSSISCTIEGFEVEGQRPVMLNNLVLVPRFAYRGRSIKVNGRDQESGVSKQDFAHPVIYDIELFTGETVSYTVHLRMEGNFPTVFITTAGNSPIRDRHTWVRGSIRIEDPRNDYSEVSTLYSEMNIRGRGNSSWVNFPKHPYRIKLDEKASVFGLPKNKDWVLLASYSDKTLMRDLTGFEISRICGMKWTPTFHPVELYLNNQYQGVYLLGDHKEVAKHRVDIDIATPDDNSGDALTGGYYFEIEQQLDEPVSWTTSMGVPMMFMDPENPTAAQKNYVQKYFNDFEAALTSSDFANASSGYARYIDVDSFVNYYIIKELVKDIDGNLRKSTFITKERGGKLEMYHVWDFDLTIGNCDYFNSMYGISNSYTDFFIRDYGAQGKNTGWYPRLFMDPVFRLKVKNRWNQLKPQLQRVPDFIEANYRFIEPAAQRNFQKWIILNTYVWPNAKVTGTYRGEVNYLLSFYNSRLQWLDTEINKW